VNHLTREEREKILSTLPPDSLAFLAAHARWKATRRPDQCIPPGDYWDIWLMLAGRGAGKTRTAAETIREWAWTQPGTRWLVSAPTYGDLDITCFNGESGLLNVIPRECIAKFNQTDLELTLTNGSIIQGISAEKPERFRGPQFHGGWLDEVAAWQYGQEAFDLLMMGMRLGQHPKLLLTTTPKPSLMIRDLVARNGKDVVVTRASTYDNRDNLAPTLFRQITRYEGTLYGRQEIYGELLDPAEQGIIRRSWLNLWPADKRLPVFDFIIVSLDTAFTEETRDKKKNEADFTACTIWGLFREAKTYGFLLLDCWKERLGLPDLIERVKKELKVQYGEADKPVIKPLFGPNREETFGRKPDLLLIEDKGSGISLRQMLSRENIHAYAYNPGRAAKVARLHAVSPLFAHGFVWVPESENKAGSPKSWVEPLIDELTMFTGEGSIPHDDYVDSTTQALRYFSDRNFISATESNEEEDEQPSQPVVNPYAA
jgi:predicted phage terminase large subunit-like protein